jgi:excinuclease ABC subunit C
MKDSRGVVLYVGKAKNLRKRVSSYFKPQTNSYKISVLAKAICDLETIVTETEVEALLLENTLIKEYQPKFNVMLKDDKTYPYIRITKNEAFPRIMKSRLRLNDGARYFGPYPSDSVVNRTLALLEDIFQYRKCPNPMPRRVCLSYHLKRCVAPCELDEGRQAHAGIIQDVIDVLQGHDARVLLEINARMQALAKEKHFEEAALWRDRMQALKELQSRQRVVRADVKDVDVFAFAFEGKKAYVCVLEYREGCLMGQGGYFISRSGGSEAVADSDVLSPAVLQHYIARDSIPPEILFEKFPGDLALIRRWILEKKNNTACQLLEARQGIRKQLVLLAKRNAMERCRQKPFSVSDDDKNEILKNLQTTLKLQQLPRHMECVDISNLGHKIISGATVAFYEGRPEKRFYRHYSITLPHENPDDYMAIRQTVQRRFSNSDLPRPQLFLVDGGDTHVAEVLRVLERMHIHDVDVLGLAKRQETVIHPRQGIRLQLSPQDPAQRLLLAMRNEAHRFSNRLRKTQYESITLKSVLGELPGIGPKRQALLLKHFGSVENMAQAPLNKLQALPFLPEAVARQMHRQLRQAMNKQP